MKTIIELIKEQINNKKEPEFIAFISDGKKCFIPIENNCVDCLDAKSFLEKILEKIKLNHIEKLSTAKNLTNNFCTLYDKDHKFIIHLFNKHLINVDDMNNINNNTFMDLSEEELQSYIDDICVLLGVIQDE